MSEKIKVDGRRGTVASSLLTMRRTLPPKCATPVPAALAAPLRKARRAEHVEFPERVAALVEIKRANVTGHVRRLLDVPGVELHDVPRRAELRLADALHRHPDVQKADAAIARRRKKENPLVGGDD